MERVFVDLRPGRTELTCRQLVLQGQPFARVEQLNMNVTAYPLCWPAGWPKTLPQQRESAKFKATLSSALNGLKREVELLGGKRLVLSSNYTLGNEHPRESGVVAYFNYNDAAVAIPCDRWLKIEDNVRAIALTIEAMRGMERWGAKHMIAAMFTGFKQLEAKTGGISWWEVLGVAPDAGAEQIKAAYRDRARVCHPDVGGSSEAMATLNAAYEMALSQNGRFEVAA